MTPPEKQSDQPRWEFGPMRIRERYHMDGAFGRLVDMMGSVLIWFVVTVLLFWQLGQLLNGRIQFFSFDRAGVEIIPIRIAPHEGTHFELQVTHPTFIIHHQEKTIVRFASGVSYPTTVDPEPGRRHSLKGCAYIVAGGVCFLFGLVLLRAGFCNDWNKWYFGILAVLVGLTLLKGFIEFVRHGAELLDPSTRESVTQKCLTRPYLCNTVIDMANVLSAEKQTAIIAARNLGTEES